MLGVVEERVEAEVRLPAHRQLREGRTTVGAYAIAGAWGGYYTRFGGKIITSRAKWLATFVEEEEQ